MELVYKLSLLLIREYILNMYSLSLNPLLESWKALEAKNMKYKEEKAALDIIEEREKAREERIRKEYKRIKALQESERKNRMLETVMSSILSRP